MRRSETEEFNSGKALRPPIEPAQYIVRATRIRLVVNCLQAFETFVGVKGQHQLVFDGEANALARARRTYFSIAAISSKDAVPENDVTTVVGICLAAL